MIETLYTSHMQIILGLSEVWKIDIRCTFEVTVGKRYRFAEALSAQPSNASSAFSMIAAS